MTSRYDMNADGVRMTLTLDFYCVVLEHAFTSQVPVNVAIGLPGFDMLGGPTMVTCVQHSEDSPGEEALRSGKTTIKPA